MAEAPQPKNNNGITLPPSVPFLGGTKITGTNAILAIMLFGACLWIYKENDKRNQQFAALQARLDHAEDTLDKRLEAVRQNRFEQLAEVKTELSCKIDVAVFAFQFPRGAIEWGSLPPELYECFPKNFRVK